MISSRLVNSIRQVALIIFLKDLSDGCHYDFTTVLELTRLDLARALDYVLTIGLLI